MTTWSMKLRQFATVKFIPKNQIVVTYQIFIIGFFEKTNLKKKVSRSPH